MAVPRQIVEAALKEDRMRRIALYGKPGAGKSTFAGILTDEFEASGARVVVVKLAAPLYELQAVIHAMAGAPLLDSAAQDGRLLNDLGVHLRRINPDALTDAFSRRVAQAERDWPDAVLLCDDMRALDVEAVTCLGFDLAEVVAPDAARSARKQARADLSAGDEDHPTEAPVAATPRWRVVNDGSLDVLRVLAARIAAEALR